MLSQDFRFNHFGEEKGGKTTKSKHKRGCNMQHLNKFKSKEFGDHMSEYLKHLETLHFPGSTHLGLQAFQRFKGNQKNN